MKNGNIMFAVTTRVQGSGKNLKRPAVSVWHIAMRTIVVMLLSLYTSCPAWADSGPFDWSRSPDGRPFVAAPSVAGQSTQSSYGTYSPTIYPVGTDALPSDAYDPTSTRSNKPGVRRGHDEEVEYPEIGQSTQSPIGEAGVLFAFAALFAGAVALRRIRQNRQTP